ncbi:hypothetical protein ACFC0M_10525 [Streptomyces sp. NPDC056149]|uniref:hypothetical protein n=1 Tax=Streptomyces sp. NPDC056149 TaxID=3345728 RepID=UPI0035D772F8
MTFVDAAVRLPDEGGSWRTLLFRRSRCLELNWDAGIRYLGEITEYRKQWRSLRRSSFARDVGAAVQLADEGGSWRTLLFQGDQCLVLNWDGGVRFHGKIIELGVQWRGLQGTPFAQDLDAAVELPDEGGSWRTMLFQGNRCLVLNWDTGIRYHGRITDFGGQWKNLPPSFFGNYDEALQIPDEGGSWRTLLFKGDECLVLNWDAGIGYQGPVSEFGEAWREAHRALSRTPIFG